MAKSAPALLTIGYEGCVVGSVVDALREAGVTRLLDVRAVPSSRKPGFSKNLLASTLHEAGIGYTHLRALGTPKPGREAARRGDAATMHRIFNAHMQQPEAQAELERAIAIAREAPVCLLCFERDHTNCHRSILAQMIQHRTGQKVRHLMAEAV
jgi:uncharacterized protein (DUF488 family)